MKSWLIRKDPDGRIWGQEEKVRQRIRWLDGIIDSMDMSLSKLQEIVKEREAWWAVSMGWQSQIRLSNWTTTTELQCLKSHPQSGCATWLLFPIHCREEANSDSILKLFRWLVFCCFCYYNHTECPTSKNPAPLPVKLKCLGSESWPPVEGRKEEINTSPAWLLPF